MSVAHLMTHTAAERLTPPPGTPLEMRWTSDHGLYSLQTRVVRRRPTRNGVILELTLLEEKREEKKMTEETEVFAGIVSGDRKLQRFPVFDLTRTGFTVGSSPLQRGTITLMLLQLPDEEPFQFLGKVEEDGTRISFQEIQEWDRNRIIRHIGEMKRLGKV